jgi:glycosyltransferase involved in cell wall biosynthesis
MTQRIFLVSNSFSGGGAERSCNLIANLLFENGHEVFLQTIRGNDMDLVQAKFKNSSLNFPRTRNPLSVFLALWKLQRCINQFKPTHIVINCELPEFFTAFVRTQGKFIVVEHTTKPWNSFPTLGRFTRLILKVRKAKWVSVSSSQQIWMGPKSPDFVIPNLVDDRGSSSISRVKDSRVTRLVFIGRFAVEKNPLFLCLLAKRLSLPILYVGEGSLRKEMISECEKVSVSIQIEDFCLDPWQHIRPGDVVIVPSLWEGDGLVVLEAIKIGIPILISDIQDLRRLNLPDKNYFQSLKGCVELLTQNSESTNNFRVSPEKVKTILASRSPSTVYKLWIQSLVD